MIRSLSPAMAVTPQIGLDDIAAIKAAGFTTIINNRPDGEEPGQPSGAAIEAAATAAGLDYVAIPVGHGGIAPDQVGAMAAALDAATGPVLAFCRSGTRSCFLWSMARASGGDDPARLAEAAAGAGYDLSSIRPALDTLAGR